MKPVVLLQKITRDTLSFVLLIINYTFIIFVLYNAAELVRELKTEADQRNPYPYQMAVLLLAENPEEAGPDMAEDILNILKKYKAYHTKFKLYLSAGDGISPQDVTVYLDEQEFEACILQERFCQGALSGGVCIGESMLSGTIKERQNTYLRVMSDTYLVTGVYRNGFAGGEDTRIGILWNTLTENGKTEIKSKQTDALLNGQGFYVELGSEAPLDDVFLELEADAKKQGIVCEMAEMDDNYSSYQGYWYKTLNRVSAVGMLFFALTDCLAVTTVWVLRRKREFMIRKALGAGIRDILSVLLRDIIKHIAISVPFFAVLEVLYTKLCGETAEINQYTLMKYGLILAGICVTVLCSLVIPLIQIHKLNPAEGLGGD